MNFYLVRRIDKITEHRGNWCIGGMCKDCSGSIVTKVEGVCVFPLARDTWWINKPFTDQMEKEYI